jgi:hypothetical protein
MPDPKLPPDRLSIFGPPGDGPMFNLDRIIYGATIRTSGRSS